MRTEDRQRKTNMTHGHLGRLTALTLMAVSAIGLLAACGSSSSSSSSSSSAGAAGGGAAGAAGGPANRAKLVACLKQHGVTLPTRPAGARPGTGSGTTPGAGPAPGATGARRRGFFGGGAGGGRFNNPKFRAAFQACGAAGGFGRRGGTPARASIAKFVTCVSQHGYTLPKPNFSGKGPVFPAKIETNAKFIAASRACQAQLRPPAGSAPGGGGAPAA
jgi:hypothetical protein